jgi:hydrogenase expression/formation protein HypC
MCLAVPMRVISIMGDSAEVESGGVTYRTSLRLTPEARVGDYVLLHTGYAISVLEKEDAQTTLRLFKEMDALREDEK